MGIGYKWKSGNKRALKEGNVSGARKWVLGREIIKELGSFTCLIEFEKSD